ncbi:MAG: DUF5615 family PIN-like protein [Nocardioidaceae bacterium]
MTIRYLLDEHLSHAIADQLNARGIDAVAVATRPNLRSLPDHDILEAAAAEGGVLVTRNIGDFARLDRLWNSTGRTHPGILCVSTRRFPETAAFVDALTAAVIQWTESGQAISSTHAFL